MTKPLPIDDFRSVRIVLEPEDFALSTGDELLPSDLVDQETWEAITVLPDDVSIRTSNRHGKSLKLLYDLYNAWIEAVGENPDYLYDTMIDAGDEFQAATFNTLNGYYRQAIGCLRNALEQVIIGASCQICGNTTDFTKWRAGQIELHYGYACNKLMCAIPLQPLKKELQETLNDSIFDQKTKTNPGGWARRLYSDLSDYSHTRPGFTNVDMWASNGPIYVREAFISTTEMYLQVSALNYILVKLSRPTFNLPPDALRVFGLSEIRPIRIARVSYEYLFPTKI